MTRSALPLVLLGAVAGLLPAEEALTYAKDIAPIFTARCTECHGEKKAKAGLRLHTLEATLKGDTHGPVVVPGKPESSKVYELIILKPGDEDIMPPKGAPLTPEQISLIKRWIAAGAK